MRKVGYVRDYNKDPITREVQYCKERLEQGEFMNEQQFKKEYEGNWNIPEDDYVYPDIYDFDGEYVAAYSEEQAREFMHFLSGVPIDELDCELLTEEQINTWKFTEEDQQYNRTFAEELEDRLADECIAPFYFDGTPFGVKE